MRTDLPPREEFRPAEPSAVASAGEDPLAAARGVVNACLLTTGVAILGLLIALLIVGA